MIAQPRIISRMTLLAGACWLGLADAASAQTGGSSQKTAEQLVSLELCADTDRVVAGQTFYLAFLFDIDPKWHIYWESPGATGTPTFVEVSAPDGFETGPTLFTRPQRFGSPDSFEGVTIGYADHAALLVPVTAPSDLEPGVELTFTADVMWLVCQKVCLMGQATPSITLTTGEASGADIDDVVHRAIARLPRDLADVDGATIEFDGTRLTVSTPAREFENATLFPLERPGVTFGEPEVSVAGGVATVTVVVEIARQNALGEPIVLAGVLGLGSDPDDPCYSFALPVPES